MRRNNNNAMREITVRYVGTCAETGKPIPAGSVALYCPTTRKLYHEESKQAEEFRAMRFSRSWGMADANW